jgi:2-polyprenyl-3-methyl-5-hydroxy-6-metoxy-1,4-benzoquinol methylase
MIFEESSETAWPPVRCDLCNGKLETVAQVPNYVAGPDKNIIHKLFPLQICTNCQTLMLLISPSEMERHLDVASHTNPEYEEIFHKMRHKYFSWLIKHYLRTETGKKKKVLDFGTSFGHMTNMLTREGYDVTGVEINETMRQTAARNSPKIRFVSNLDELSDETGSFDIVLAIDSLYYVTSPNETIFKLSKLLKTNGIIILRNANRNWYYKIKRLIMKNNIMPTNPIGDARYGFSVKGMRDVLIRNGMESIEVRYLERGKDLGLIKKILYFISGIIAQITHGLIPWSPGTIITATKR